MSVMMVMSVIFTLVVNEPCLTRRAIRFIGVNVLVVNELISEDVHGISGEPVGHFLRSNIVSESLVVEASPVIDDHVPVVAFEESTSFLSNRLQALFFGIPDPLLVDVWFYFSFEFLEEDVVYACDSWSILIKRTDCNSHLISIFIQFVGQ